MKAMTKPNSAFYLYYDRALPLFSRPMRVKDTSALREMFQHYSLVRSLSTNARQRHIEELSNSKTRVNQTMPNDLLPLTIAGVLDSYVSKEYDFRNKEC